MFNTMSSVGVSLAGVFNTEKFRWCEFGWQILDKQLKKNALAIAVEAGSMERK